MHSQHHPTFHIKSSLALGAAMLLWSTVPLFLRSFIHEIDGWTANGLRYPFAALLWSVPLAVYLKQGKIDPRLFRLALIPSLVNLIAQTFWAWTIYYMEPGLVMFLARIGLLFSFVMSMALFQDERRLLRSPLFWIGIVFALFGFIGMNLASGALAAKGTWIGLLIVLGQAFFMALYGVSVRYTMRGFKPWHSFPVIALYTSAGLIVLMMLFGNPQQVFEMPFNRIVLLGISAIIGIALAHICYYYALEHLGVSISAGCLLLTPFLTTAGSYVIYGEFFSIGQWMFGCVILVGAAVLLTAQRHLGGSVKKKTG